MSQAALPGSTLRRRAFFALLLLIAGAGWGLTIALANIAMADGRDAVGVSFWSTVIGLTVLSLWLAVTGERPPLSPTMLWFFAVTGLLGTALPQVLSNGAAVHLPAGLRSVILSSVPMVTLALSIALSLERPSLRRALGLMLGVAGIAIIAAPDLFSDQTTRAIWIIASFVVVGSYAAENVYIALRRPEGLDEIAALWGMSLAAMVMLGVAGGVFGADFDVFDGGSGADAAIVGIAVLHLAAYAALLRLIRLAGPVFASQVSYVVTPAGVLWGAALLGESITLGIAAAVALVLGGIALTRANP